MLDESKDIQYLSHKTRREMFNEFLKKILRIRQENGCIQEHIIIF